MQGIMDVDYLYGYLLLQNFHRNNWKVPVTIVIRVRVQLRPVTSTAREMWRQTASKRGEKGETDRTRVQCCT